MSLLICASKFTPYKTSKKFLNSLGMDYCALQQMDDEIDIVMNELDPNERLSPRGTLYEGVWFYFSNVYF